MCEAVSFNFACGVLDTALWVEKRRVINFAKSFVSRDSRTGMACFAYNAWVLYRKEVMLCVLNGGIRRHMS